MSSRLTADDCAVLGAAAGDPEVLRFNEPMARRTTLKLGGPADGWFVPTSVDQLARVIAVAASRDVPMIAVGGGSNLLVRDGGIRGLVIATKGLRGLERIADTVVRVEAGVSTGKLLSMATTWELGGLEFLGGVPGSVGGGLIMNAGTYLGEFTNVVTEVTSVRLSDGGQVTRSHAECGFRYRASDLPPSEIAVSARLQLTPRGRALIEADVDGLRARRKEREPSGVHNAGSTFKNPPGEFAGRLIESCGLKGLRVGEAECSPVHANWLVNRGGATATDLLSLIEQVRERVLVETGVALELEVKVIGEDL